jgi:hypothetical protein
MRPEAPLSSRSAERSGLSVLRPLPFGPAAASAVANCPVASALLLLGGAAVVRSIRCLLCWMSRRLGVAPTLRAASAPKGRPPSFGDARYTSPYSLVLIALLAWRSSPRLCSWSRLRTEQRAQGSQRPRIRSRASARAAAGGDCRLGRRPRRYARLRAFLSRPFDSAIGISVRSTSRFCVARTCGVV